MSRFKEKCPVCDGSHSGQVRSIDIESAVPYGRGEFEDRTNASMGMQIECPRCGVFVVTELDYVNLLSPGKLPVKERSRLSALLYERSISSSLPKYWLRGWMNQYGPLVRSDLTPIDYGELSSLWPRTVAERLDRMLCNIVKYSVNPGDEIHLECRKPNFQSIAFASADLEARYYFKALVSRGDLTSMGLTNTGVSVIVAPEGWARVTELERNSAARTNKVFVAMWFGVPGTAGLSSEWSPDRMLQVYNDGIASGVRLAGYDVTRVDLEQYNEGVMDKVLGDIRAAPFVVADFTGHRNGVYLEAGFASGLGKQVIHTCHESYFRDAHFDIAHINRIKWTNVADLQELLYQRIRGSIGEGPFVAAGPPARD